METLGVGRSCGIHMDEEPGFGAVP